MTVLPDYFEYRRPRGGFHEANQFYPFSFSSDTQTFQIGDASIEAANFDPDMLITGNMPKLGGKLIDLDELALYSAVISDESRVMATPILHKWILDHREQVAGTAAIMLEVYGIFVHDDEMEISEYPGALGFSARVFDDNALRLHVSGNCACLGPSQEGGLGYTVGLEKGYATYELHNADTQAQRTALYAGLGHIAQQAARS